ncbi:MAG: Oligoendopeptidase, pepF/M3 family [candidate division WWE3 bacterium GW2011_GWC2_41_23]|uniref:Oligoendopeptidase, pepF/M3 family n=1 Tax=candidate division WWE3 bacterium GW2011_GWC2_41_23 TaxID=1619123 RepID=A0A0G0YQV5_UNCKA|nr:MAG: Oligoendopeptidase, pepF/M3 family [candidate division WWE3 bacterium GW2011_GWC2_41_23]
MHNMVPDFEMKKEWNFGLLYRNADKKDLEAELVNLDFSAKWKGRTDYLEDPEVLKQLLDEDERISATIGTSGKPGYYYWLKYQLEQQNSEIKAELSKIDDIGTFLENELEFITQGISRIPAEKQPLFLNYPGLSGYKHLLQRLFDSAKYLLTEPEEKILNLTAKTAQGNWVSMISDFLSREERKILDEADKEKEANLSEILEAINSTDKKVRDAAGVALNDIFAKHAPAAEYELNSVLHNKKVTDELRGFSRPDMSRHLADDIDTEVVDSLIESVTSRFDISQRFYKLKAKLLGVEKLQYHERNVDYGNSGEKYDFNKTAGLVSKVFNALDSEFGTIFENFLREGKIDVFPKKGKESGAFCVHMEKDLPVFVMLNHTDRLNDVTTLAHEMGHAINFELMKKEQNALNCGTYTCTAEVASTFMEDFVLDEIEKGVDEARRLEILMERLNGDISSIQRQVACYNFEKDLHTIYRSEGFLPLKRIGELFLKNMGAYMGEAVEMSPGAENWWVYWSHIRSYFYVYSYASGVMISKSLKNMVGDDLGFVQKVKNFLSMGTSVSPRESFEELGIDIADKGFWMKGLEELDSMVAEAEELARKLGRV